VLERPRCGRAAEERDELTPCQLIELHPHKLIGGQIEGYQDIKKRRASQAVAKLDFVTHHPLPMTGLGGKPISRSQWKDGFGADSGPSRGDRCRRALRPIEASKTVVCYVRFTSVRDVLERPGYTNIGHSAMASPKGQIDPQR
jgi:hypothetical protein